MTDRAPLPYEFLPEVPSFTVESDDVAARPAAWATPRSTTASGCRARTSPRSCAGTASRAETKGFAVTCYDPDAPTGSGFWHWLVLDLPASVTELAAGAGAAGAQLPGSAFSVRNDYGTKDFGGAAPPQGDPAHRYVFAVHALDTDNLGIDSDVSPAVAGFNLRFHTIARAMIIPVFGH